MRSKSGTWLHVRELLSALALPQLALCCLALCGVAACEGPPPSAFIGGAASSGRATSLGTDAGGDACNLLPSGSANSADIYCGTWQLPAAHVRVAGTGDPASLHALATTGPWRETLDLRYACEAPVATTILGSEPALVMQCTRRVGGWPQIALAAAIGGKAYLADGILPTLPVMERAIGVQSGRVTANVASMPRSETDALLARQLASHAFSATDVGDYQKLMALGARNNLAENFAAAETAYRAALALQQKALGKANPDTVDAMMSLALQLSDQQRFSEADALFRQAEPLAAKSTDKAAPARLWHYEALNALNQGRNAQALTLLDRADGGYASLVPAGSLSGASSLAATNGTQTQAVAPVTDAQLMVDPTAQSSLMGLIEVRRYKAVVLRLLGRPAEGAAAIDSAETLARTNSMLVPLVAARLTRTAANIDAASGESGATAGLARSQQNFSDVLPQTRPVAETALLQAREYAARGDTATAITLCRGATTLLRELRSGTDSALLQPCLTSFA
ncbi:MAG TPA: hypothetical protein VGM42_00770, partial [Rhodopila sp.]